MDSLERAGYLAHSHSLAFNRKVECSLAIVREWLSTCDAPYVAYSGGKDSEVCLHLVRSIAPDTPALWWHDEWVLPETEERVEAVPNLRKIAAHVRHSEWFASWKDREALPSDVEWVERTPSEGEGTWKLGYDGAAVGLRADENADRKRHIRAYGTLTHSAKNRQWQCYPVAWWSTRDIWAYLLSREIPYNRAYDRLAEIGVEPQRQRIGPLAVSGAMERGQIAILKQGWPELYERFAEAHPEASGYV